MKLLPTFQCVPRMLYVKEVFPSKAFNKNSFVLCKAFKWLGWFHFQIFGGTWLGKDLSARSFNSLIQMFFVSQVYIIIHILWILITNLSNNFQFDVLLSRLFTWTFVATFWFYLFGLLFFRFFCLGILATERDKNIIIRWFWF